MLNIIYSHRTLNHQFHIRRIAKRQSAAVHGHVVTRATEIEALSKLFSRAERDAVLARREVYDFTLLPRRCIVKMYYGRACIERGLISCLHLIVPVLEQRLWVVLLTATPPRRRCAPPRRWVYFTFRGYIRPVFALLARRYVTHAFSSFPPSRKC